MDASDFIAIFAVFVSLGSAWISHRAYGYTVRVKEEEVRLSLSREKSEFLVRIDKSRKTFDRLEHRLRSLLSVIDRASEIVRVDLAAEVAMLEADLKYVSGCQRQAWSLWNETYEMGESGLAHHKPQFLGLLEDDENFSSQAHARCDQAEVAITKVVPSLTKHES